MKTFPRIITEAFHQPWLMMEEHIASSFGLLNSFAENVMQGNAAELEMKVNQDHLPTIQAAMGNNGAGFTGGNVAVISIKGAIAKNDYCGTPGTATIAGWLADFDQDKAISGVVLDVDSGGGAVHGTLELIEAYEKFSKPKVTLVNGIAGSAAYMIIAPSNHILLRNEMAIVGSAGVMQTISRLMEDTPQKIMGMTVELKTLYGKLSSRKNEGSREYQDEKTTKKFQTELDNIDTFFTNKVAEYRTEASADALEGLHFYGQKGIDAGLADGMGNLQDAVNKVAELAANGKQAKTKSDPNMATEVKVPMDEWGKANTKATAFDALGGAMNLEATIPEKKLAAAGESAVANATVVAEITAAFGDEAKAEGFNAAAAITALKADKATALAKVTEHEATIAKLEKEPKERKQTLASERATVVAGASSEKVYEAKGVAKMDAFADLQEKFNNRHN